MAFTSVLAKDLLRGHQLQVHAVIVLEEFDIHQGIEDRLASTREIVLVEFLGVMHDDLHLHALGLGQFDLFITMPRAGSSIEERVFPELPESAVGHGVPVFPPQFVGRRGY